MVKQSYSCLLVFNPCYCKFNHLALNKDGSCMFVSTISRLTSSASQMGFHYRARMALLSSPFWGDCRGFVNFPGGFKARGKLGKPGESAQRMSWQAVRAFWMGLLSAIPNSLGQKSPVWGSVGLPPISRGLPFPGRVKCPLEMPLVLSRGSERPAQTRLLQLETKGCSEQALSPLSTLSKRQVAA